jgi:hypothetical protein
MHIVTPIPKELAGYVLFFPRKFKNLNKAYLFKKEVQIRWTLYSRPGKGVFLVAKC